MGILANLQEVQLELVQVIFIWNGLIYFLICLDFYGYSTLLPTTLLNESKQTTFSILDLFMLTTKRIAEMFHVESCQYNISSQKHRNKKLEIKLMIVLIEILHNIQANASYSQIKSRLVCISLRIRVVFTLSHQSKAHKFQN